MIYCVVTELSKMLKYEKLSPGSHDYNIFLLLYIWYFWFLGMQTFVFFVRYSLSNFLVHTMYFFGNLGIMKYSAHKLTTRII